MAARWFSFAEHRRSPRKKTAFLAFHSPRWTGAQTNRAAFPSPLHYVRRDAEVARETLPEGCGHSGEMAPSKKKGDESPADRLDRIAIVSADRCRPKKCRQECKKSCPVVKIGAFLEHADGGWGWKIKKGKGQRHRVVRRVCSGRGCVCARACVCERACDYTR